LPFLEAARPGEKFGASLLVRRVFFLARGCGVLMDVPSVRAISSILGVGITALILLPRLFEPGQPFVRRSE